MARLMEFLNPPIVTTEPPTDAQIQRNDWVLFGCVLLLLAFGWLVRLAALDTGRSVDLGIGLPAIAYPAGWHVSTPAQDAATGVPAGPAEEVLFEATDPASPSTFSPLIRIESRPVLQGESIDALRVTMGMRRSRELDRYRELTAQPVPVLDGRPAILTTYAYVADPTLDAGSYGLPVVVQAQDLLFRHDNRWLVATMAADATSFGDAAGSAQMTGSADLAGSTEIAAAFAQFYDSLALNQNVTFAAPFSGEDLPAATPAPEGTQP